MSIIGHSTISTELEVEIMPLVAILHHLSRGLRGGVRDRHIVQIVLECLRARDRLFGTRRDSILLVGYVSVILNVALTVHIEVSVADPVLKRAAPSVLTLVRSGLVATEVHLICSQLLLESVSVD